MYLTAKYVGIAHVSFNTYSIINYFDSFRSTYFNILTHITSTNCAEYLYVSKQLNSVRHRTGRLFSTWNSLKSEMHSFKNKTNQHNIFKFIFKNTLRYPDHLTKYIIGPEGLSKMPE